ncbi:MAG: helix-turn-helix domain-containing protein [Micromonosporaceae bacterium]
MSGQDYIGKRVARWRDLAGMTQQELADRLGRTRNWVSMVENGHRAIQRRDTLIALANALRVDVQQLIAQPSVRTQDELTVRRSIPSLRAALYGPDEAPEPRGVDDVAEDVHRLMAARMACDYVAMAELGAALVAETTVLVESGRDGRRARELSVRTLWALSQAIKPMGYVDLALALAERASSLAGELEGPAELAASRFALSQAILASGSRRRSLSLATKAAADAQGSAAPGALAWYGILQLQVGLASASLGMSADTHLAEARDVASRRPEDPWLMEFTTANTATWASAMALETGNYDSVVSITSTANRHELRSRQRKAHLLMNQGRGYYAAGDHERAVRSILEADEIAPAEVRSRPTIREIVGQMTRDAFRGTELATLAARVRVDPLM